MTGRLGRSLFAAALLAVAVFASVAAAAGEPQTVTLDGTTVTLPNQGDTPKVTLNENVAIDCVAGSISVATKVELSGNDKSLSITAPSGLAVLGVSIKSGSDNTTTVVFTSTGATVTTTQGISNYVIVFCQPIPRDTTPPNCVLIAKNDLSIMITVEDPQSGIATIVPVEVVNATVTYSPNPFAGTTSPVLVTGTKLDSSKSGFLKIAVTNGAGVTTVCDPPIPASKAARKKSQVRLGLDSARTQRLHLSRMT